MGLDLALPLGSPYTPTFIRVSPAVMEVAGLCDDLAIGLFAKILLSTNTHARTAELDLSNNRSEPSQVWNQTQKGIVLRPWIPFCV